VTAARRFLALAAVAALFAGSAMAWPPGAGWSRAPDLSVYGAMRAFARKAVEQDVLCQGRNQNRVSAQWSHDFGARQSWVDQAMERRYGAAFMSRAVTPYTPRISCTDVPDPRWRDQYSRLLRLLEIRFGLGSQRGG
jgi:hypothetical protein